MTPPLGDASGASHPRRAPAHRSVSLLHSPRKRPVPPPKRSDSSGDSDPPDSRPSRKSGKDSPSSLQPLGRNSSGESSNAENWFDKSNNDVQDTTAAFNDNETPFFMRNSSSSATPPELQQTKLRQFPRANDEVQSLPLRAGLLHLGTDGSSTEDFRSVIDDLTIENKKLKRRLKKYEKLHDAHLKDEKLFEVRIHGLPPDKKRELEEMLRKFTSGLSDNAKKSFPPNGYEGLWPLLQTQKTASSQTSLHNTDSAYASMSASGQGGSSSSGSKTKPFAQSAASRREDIHSYLHHLSEGLFPQPNPATMSERAKKKLVVKRLEQIFAGRGAAGGHQQPLQQQEVSQMAARADRSALEASGGCARQEGVREATIMQREAEESKHNSPDEAQPPKSAVPAKAGQQVLAESSPNQAALEQRPTRPLDLDPHRAQVPSDNIAYFRHLGFSPPEPETAKQYEEGHGWIYLNLLINMAQLHTINVTVEFVQKAITEYSDNFELSSDGRKVRWRSDAPDPTHTSSESGATYANRTGDGGLDGRSPRKRPRLSMKPRGGRSGLLGGQVPGGASMRSRAENHKVAYTPLFLHRETSEEGANSSSEEDEAMSSPFPEPIGGDSSGMTSSGVRTASTKKHQAKDDGPIIYYNNSRFITDLSAERKPDSNRNAPHYIKAASEPLGKTQRAQDGIWEKRGPLAAASDLPEPMDIGDNPIPESMELAFPESSPSSTTGGAHKSRIAKKPIDLAVTGMGGVWPADNFEINVQSRHARVDHATAPRRLPPGSKALPPKLARILDGGKAKGKLPAPVQNQVISACAKELPPSEFPPALSFMPMTDDSYDDEESSEAEDQMFISPPCPDAEPRSPAPQLVDVFSDSDDEQEDDDDTESDSSLDFLASARRADPETIRAQEREYDAHMAERLAEDIPAGSSAATAGGGSGFASPASDIAGEEHRRAKQEARAATAAPQPQTKRAETTDSMKVLGASTKEDDSDEQED